MIVEAARAAASRLFTPAFRGVLMKSLGLTLLGLVGLWFAARFLFDWLALPLLDSLLPGLPAWAGWLGVVAAVLAGVGLALLLALLIAPVTALIANLFLDDAAEIIERADYPDDPPGRPLDFATSLVSSLKFLGVVIAGNLLALALLIVPGVNIVGFFVINGYLIGREFFEFAAMRHRPPAEARSLRRANAVTVFLAGLVIAAFMAVPVLNLATPLFAAAMMVHLHKMLTGARPGRDDARASIRRAA
ncbi:MAG: sulfate transporter family protein [Rhizobiaceae bacterium]